MAIPEGEAKEKEAEETYKAKIAENFPNIGREMDIQIMRHKDFKQVEPKQEYNEIYCN